jgi:hypothetical protein
MASVFFGGLIGIYFLENRLSQLEEFVKKPLEKIGVHSIFYIKIMLSCLIFWFIYKSSKEPRIELYVVIYLYMHFLFINKLAILIGL